MGTIQTSVDQQDTLANGNTMRRTTGDEVSTKINTNGDLNINAGNTIYGRAVQVQSSGSTTINAQAIILEQANKTNSSAINIKGNGSVFNAQSVSNMAKLNELKTGANLDLNAQNQIDITGLNANAGQDINIQAATVSINSGQSSDQSFSHVEEKGHGFFGSDRSATDSSSKLTHSENTLDAGGNININTTGNQRYELLNARAGSQPQAEVSNEPASNQTSAATISSTGTTTANINLTSTDGKVTFAAVTDSQQRQHDETHSGLFVIKQFGMAQAYETFRQTQLAATGTVAIKAAQGIEIALKQFDQKTPVTGTPATLDQLNTLSDYNKTGVVTDNTINTTIDLMVSQDPSLAWLKTAQMEGSVDYSLVKELHQSSSYKETSMGPVTSIAIAIAVAAIVVARK